jgi:putative methionine-R-sulfoxide reductase with GAF domain
VASLTTDARPDYWPARAGYLASLISADALVIVVIGADGKRIAFAQHNLADLGHAVDVDARPLPIQLADGRAAQHRFAVPLIWKDRVFGSVVGLRVEREWESEGLRALTRAAGLVAIDLADAFSLWDSTRTAAKFERRMRTLEEIRREIARADDPEKMIAVAANRVGELFDASGVSVMLLQNDDELVVRSAFGANEQVVRAARRRLGEGISGWVASHGQPVVLSGRVDDARFTGVDPTIEEALVVPLRNGSRVLGVVNVRARREVGANDGERLQDLNIVAQDLAAMIERAEAAVARLAMIQRLETDRGQALALFDLARLAGIGSDPQGDLDAASSLVAHAFRHEVVGIWTPNGDPRRLHLRAAFGYGEVLPGDVYLDGDEFAASVVGETRPRHLRGAGARSWMSARADEYVLVPIRVTDESSGMLVLGRLQDPYSDIDVDIGMTIADFLSSLAQRELSARLLEESKAERRQVIEEMQQDFAAQLSRVVMVLDLTQRLLRKDPDLPTQLATAAREARSFLGRFGAYVAGLQDGDAPALVDGIPLVAIENVAETAAPHRTPAASATTTLGAESTA